MGKTERCVYAIRWENGMREGNERDGGESTTKKESESGINRERVKLAKIRDNFVKRMEVGRKIKYMLIVKQSSYESLSSISLRPSFFLLPSLFFNFSLYFYFIISLSSLLSIHIPSYHLPSLYLSLTLF